MGGAKLGHPVSNETRLKISKANTGKTWSEEKKKQFSIKCKGRIISSEARHKISLARKGHLVSSETRYKISQKNTGHVVSQEVRDVIGKKAKEQHDRRFSIKSEDEDAIIRAYTIALLPIYKVSDLLGYAGWRIKELLVRKGFRIRSKGEEISRASRRMWKNLPEGERNRRINMWINAGKRASKLPNKSELFLWSILYGVMPGEYEYTGWQVPGKTIAIGGLRPDFFNMGKQKKVIELFGGRYHPIELELSKEKTEHLRTDVYNGFGFECLIIRDFELKSPIKVALKALHFNEEFNGGEHRGED